jgi:hypothetical protein
MAGSKGSDDGACSKTKESPRARKGLVTILLCKIAARPCSLDCSENPAANRRSVCEELERKARFFAVGIEPSPPRCGVSHTIEQSPQQKMRTIVLKQPQWRIEFEQ